MNTNQLQCFLAVAQNLNFARAAEEMHITQPAVTHQINSLENELNVTLFKRTTRSVSMTAHGIRFLSDAKKILSDMQMAMAHLKHKEDTEPLHFAIGCHNINELEFLPHLLPKMVNFFPNLHPDVKTLPLRALSNLLKTDAIDVMFNFQEEKGRTAPGQFKELLKAPIVCAIPKNHSLSKSTIISKKDLSAEHLTIQEPPNTLPAIVTLQSELLQAHNPSEVYFCESTEAALTLTKSNLGITILPDIHVMRDSSICYIPFDSTITIPYGIYYKTVKGKPLIKKFLEIAEEYFVNGI